MPTFLHAIRAFFRAVRAPQHAETETTFFPGSHAWNRPERERFETDREDLLRLSLQAWRGNPLARRIVGLTTQYVVGGGLRVRAEDDAARAFLTEWWDHRLNQLAMRVYEWCDELTRAGELFLLLSTDAAGMSYARAVPAGEIIAIETAENDLQQETAYLQRGAALDSPRRWPAAGAVPHRREDGAFAPVMLHYAINRPAGTVRGESDLAPLLRWLNRYAAWLEDRARLNRYRNAFLFVVKGRWQSEAERLARQNQLAASPPPPGSFLVADESEHWDVIAPRLESHEAGEDGLALKKIIAAGAGLPLHFLAEPEGSNRSTAEAAGGPTYRHFEQRQEFFTWLIGDLARVVLERRALVDRAVDPATAIQVTGADLSARDNAALAVAMSTVTGALTTLRDRALIDDAELLRMAYRFAGEVADVEGLIERGKQAGASRTGSAPRRPAGVTIDPETGEAGGVAKI